MGRIHCTVNEIFGMQVWLKFKNLLVIDWEEYKMLKSLGSCKRCYSG